MARRRNTRRKPSLLNRIRGGARRLWREGTMRNPSRLPAKRKRIWAGIAIGTLASTVLGVSMAPGLYNAAGKLGKKLRRIRLNRSPLSLIRRKKASLRLRAGKTRIAKSIPARRRARRSLIVNTIRKLNRVARSQRSPHRRRRK